MTLKVKYILFIALVHSILLVFSFYWLKDNKILFIVTEALILLSIGASVMLYQDFIQPLKLIMTGIDSIKDKDFNVKFVKTGKYEMDQLIGVYNMMIDKLREERTLQQQQHFFLENLIQASPIGIIILDFDQKIASINPKAAQFIDLTDQTIFGKALNEVSHPLLEALTDLPSGESKTVSINGIEMYKCQKSHFVDRGFQRYFITIEELSAELLKAEKNAYGKVIRMMAHEVNNSIGPINSILDSALTYKAIEKPEYIHALQVAMERNQRLNIFMRNFADVVRLPQPQREQADIHHIIRDVATLMEQQAIASGIEFNIDIPDLPFLVFIDVQQIEQVLVNIIKNAIESIEQNGKIEFISKPDLRTLIVQDSGKGISKEAAAQLFSPFFSTKREGQGIGLTLIREILLNHDCDFSLQTLATGYTEFRIVFA
ncbi:sensor histidine kinase [Xanthocytophaga agilis]|uniref:histidine kinase n=1 Tax=Xanthocytophaga agilis TaxID=3048010 RepID=A0AAE3R5I2_9BACT|nr:ATP-binding protein [Xanthocytophaga agilis]MDJ1504164.1 ATP-binding protein [Xanthocytophaga agilis]